MVGSGIWGTHWPQQSSFHASFIHFITSLEECEGVEQKPCHPETEREEPHSIFSSPGSACPLSLQAACMENIAPGGGGLQAAIWAHFIEWRTHKWFDRWGFEIVRDKWETSVKIHNSCYCNALFFSYVCDNCSSPSQTKTEHIKCCADHKALWGSLGTLFFVINKSELTSWAVSFTSAN